MAGKSSPGNDLENSLALFSGTSYERSLISERKNAMEERELIFAVNESEKPALLRARGLITGHEARQSQSACYALAGYNRVAFTPWVALPGVNTPATMRQHSRTWERESGPCEFLNNPLCRNANLLSHFLAESVSIHIKLNGSVLISTPHHHPLPSPPALSFVTGCSGSILVPSRVQTVGSAHSSRLLKVPRPQFMEVYFSRPTKSDAVLICCTVNGGIYRDVLASNWRAGSLFLHTKYFFPHVPLKGCRQSLTCRFNLK
ncbi:hypothetical protein CEXT_225481 [Caerostris extrusa]|uniref:Ig-like domain-containing protein n=1 Tax=Caerostris extrusa TaxID=172846 RepID=A0AAV4PPL6_CAEEX|nr:hypothetical protein CEXT_225481 [Caerostris extrusa]